MEMYSFVKSESKGSVKSDINQLTVD
jgi:chromosome segregation ATPase